MSNSKPYLKPNRTRDALVSGNQNMPQIAHSTGLLWAAESFPPEPSLNPLWQARDASMKELIRGGSITVSDFICFAQASEKNIQFFSRQFSEGIENAILQLKYGQVVDDTDAILVDAVLEVGFK